MTFRIEYQRRVLYLLTEIRELLTAGTTHVKNADSSLVQKCFSLENLYTLDATLEDKDVAHQMVNSNYFLYILVHGWLTIIDSFY